MLELPGSAPLLARRLGSALILLALTGITVARADGDYRTIGWRDLVPGGAAVGAPSVNHSGDPFDPAVQSLAADALDRILVKELDGVDVTLAGFIVPLNINEKDRVDEFLLVPYFGACIHVPPPPPNQIVHVRYEQGLDPEQLYEPFTIQGALKVGGVDSPLAQAGYALTADAAKIYEY